MKNILPAFSCFQKIIVLTRNSNCRGKTLKGKQTKFSTTGKTCPFFPNNSLRKSIDMLIKEHTAKVRQQFCAPVELSLRINF